MTTNPEPEAPAAEAPAADATPDLVADSAEVLVADNSGAVVQIVDGYLIVPYVARKTVDLAPALVLGAQLLFGALFGILGLALADPIVAMIKAALQQKSIEESGNAAGAAEP